VTFSREVVLAGMLKEYRNFGELLTHISDNDWGKPSRCADWRVRDVTAHVVGQLSDLASELTSSVAMAKEIGDSFNDAAWTARAPGAMNRTLGFAMEGLWFDTYLHADDIRNIFRIPTRDREGLVASVSYLAQLLTEQDWGPATLALTGIRSFNVGNGGERFVTGEPLTFVLVATGRADPAVIGLDETVNIYRPVAGSAEPKAASSTTRKNWSWRTG